MRRFFPKQALVFLALALLGGCGEDDEKRFRPRVVALDKVPAEIMAAAKKALPDVTFEDARTNHEEGKEAIHSYEIRGRVRATNKVREVRVGLDGKILEIE